MKVPHDWTFKSAAIADRFDQHVREQLPWYELVSGAVAHLARAYLPEKGLIYDIGASTGNIGRAIADTLAIRKASLIAIESSQEMADRYVGPGEIVVHDARDYPFARFDVAVLYLVAMFTPVDGRARWIKNLARLCKPGGAVIVVDKTLPLPGYLGSTLYSLTLAGKLAAGADATDIIAKELSLGGAQRPLDISELDGFVEWFRFGHFAGWLFEPPPAGSVELPERAVARSTTD